MVAAFEGGQALNEQANDTAHASPASTKRQRLGDQSSGVDSLEVIDIGEAERARARSDATRTPGRERPFEPESALLELASLGPEPEQRARQLDALSTKVARSGPIRVPPGRSPARSAVA